MDGKESQDEQACVREERTEKGETSRNSELLWVYIVRVPAPPTARLPLPGYPCTRASQTLTDRHETQLRPQYEIMHPSNPHQNQGVVIV